MVDQNRISATRSMDLDLDLSAGEPMDPLVEVNMRLNHSDTRMRAQEDLLALNTEATAQIASDVEHLQTQLKTNSGLLTQIQADTGDLLEAFRAAKGAFKTFNWIGKAAVPVGCLAGAAVSIYGFYQAFFKG